MRDLPQIIDYDKDQLAYALANALKERDEANQELHKQLVRYDQLFDEAEKIRIERDEAREKYDMEATEHMLAINKICGERDEWARLCGQFKQERDEAREVAKEADAGHDMAIADLAKCEAATDIIISKAKDLIERWDQPSWKDVAPTAGYIYALRNAVEDYEITKIKRNYS